VKNEIDVKNSGYTNWNHRRNEEILDKLKIIPVIDYI
jgi:hypothetical protein